MWRKLFRMKIEQLSAIELGRRIASRELSSREVTHYFLSRLNSGDQLIHAFTYVAGEKALAQAEQIDKRISAGERLSSLAGVPVAIKDVLCTLDAPTTCGSRMLQNFHAPYTATAVQKLLDAGLVLIGKTNMDEFAMGGSTETSIFGVTRNHGLLSARRVDRVVERLRRWLLEWLRFQSDQIPVDPFVNRLRFVVSAVSSLPTAE